MSSPPSEEVLAGSLPASPMRHGFGYRVEARCPHTHARTGVLSTPHGDVRTPLFMPVGTSGTVKGVQTDQLHAIGTQVVLANTYHLHLRPGEETVATLGGLHRFMHWDGPILTDSGGYQVFSLGHLTQLKEAGVTMKSVVDGSRVELSPERAVEIQARLGADIIMAFDHCPPKPGERAGVVAATERTHRWLERCVRRHRELGGEERGQALFGIVQGGAFEDLRRESVEAVTSHDLVGYAIGGVSLGEVRAEMRTAVEASAPLLPEDKPRYLMGVGTPEDFVHAIASGVDMFDCVTPTRHGRNHQVFTSRGRMNVRNKRWEHELGPLDPSCTCTTCTDYSLGYLRFLARAGEMLAAILLSVHNLHFFHTLLARTRTAIASGTYPALVREVTSTMTARL